MKAGTLVKSLAGHDREWFYIVLDTDGDFVYVTDGKHHTMNRPKKKRLRHVASCGGEADLSRICCDAHVRKAIKRLKAEGGCHLG